MAMTGGIVFILHGAEEVHYAGNVARALSPQFTAIPVQVGDRALQIGTGATCVVVCSNFLSHPSVVEAVLSSLPCADENSLLCLFEGASVPDALQHLSQVRVRGIGAAVPDAKTLGEALRARQANSEAGRGAARPRSLRSPALDAKPSSPVDQGKSQFVVRSAWGFAATMAVVGVVAPLIGARAGAVSIAPDQSGSSVDLAIGGGATAELDDSNTTEFASYSQAELISSQDPLEVVRYPLEVDMSPGAADGGPGEVVMASAMEEADGVAVAFDEAELDPKTMEVIAAMVAGSTMNDWKIDAAPVPLRHDEKPQPAFETQKPEAGA